MQKYKQAAISIAFLTIILSAGICAGYANTRSNSQSKRNLARQDAILEAFENSDYRTWKKIMADQGDVANLVNEDDFAKFVSARSAARSGDYDAAIAIAKDLEDALKNKMGLKLLT